MFNILNAQFEFMQVPCKKRPIVSEAVKTNFRFVVDNPCLQVDSERQHTNDCQWASLRNATRAWDTLTHEGWENQLSYNLFHHTTIWDNDPFRDSQFSKNIFQNATMKIVECFLDIKNKPLHGLAMHTMWLYNELDVSH